jgi:hypothetical protein
MSVDQVVQRLMISPAKVSRIETGARGVSLRDVRDLCDLYAADNADRDHLMSLARESKQASWWQEYDLDYSTFVGLEAAAFAISDYESCLVPGLLQTEDYAKAIVRGILPDAEPGVVQTQVEVRLRRQLLLTSEQPPRFWVVIDEAVVRRVVGGPSVMRSQVEALIEHGSLPNVTLQLIPFSAGAHPGMDSTFTLLHFKEAAPDVVYVEGLVGNIYFERAKDLERYQRVFDLLRAVALGPGESVAYLRRIADEMAA